MKTRAHAGNSVSTDNLQDNILATDGTRTPVIGMSLWGLSVLTAAIASVEHDWPTPGSEWQTHPLPRLR
jgi:hypothetical protein